MCMLEGLVLNYEIKWLIPGFYFVVILIGMVCDIMLWVLDVFVSVDVIVVEDM